jgi:hypothetical protein
MLIYNNFTGNINYVSIDYNIILLSHTPALKYTYTLRLWLAHLSHSLVCRIVSSFSVTSDIIFPSFRGSSLASLYLSSTCNLTACKILFSVLYVTHCAT